MSLWLSGIGMSGDSSSTSRTVGCPGFPEKLTPLTEPVEQVMNRDCPRAGVGGMSGASRCGSRGVARIPGSMNPAFGSPEHVTGERSSKPCVPLSAVWPITSRRDEEHARKITTVELKIGDEHGDFVFTQVFRSEPDAVLQAAGRHDGYLAKDWLPVQG